MSKEKIRKRIAELTHRLEVCGDQLMEIECNYHRLKNLMASDIEEKNKLELALKGDASAIMDRE